MPTALIQNVETPLQFSWEDTSMLHSVIDACTDGRTYYNSINFVALDWLCACTCLRQVYKLLAASIFVVLAVTAHTARSLKIVIKKYVAWNLKLFFVCFYFKEIIVWNVVEWLCLFLYSYIFLFSSYYEIYNQFLFFLFLCMHFSSSIFGLRLHRRHRHQNSIERQRKLEDRKSETNFSCTTQRRTCS